MNITALCDKIELQPQIKDRVLSFAADFDFSIVDRHQKGYFTYQTMKDALSQTQWILGDDADGIKILTCMLKAAADAHSVYREKGISDEIYFATMKCFPRFIEETYKLTGKLCFDRYWWTTRQAGCHLFRIGALEYELKHTENGVVIGIHIPSDADFSPSAVDKSLHDAKAFFPMYDPSLQGAAYCCRSWLLDSQLKNMLSTHSNIIHFQNRFDIIPDGKICTSFIEWLYQTKSTDYNSLPEDTSLQKNMKKHLLAGGVVWNAYGILKDIY